MNDKWCQKDHCSRENVCCTLTDGEREVEMGVMEKNKHQGIDC